MHVCRPSIGAAWTERARPGRPERGGIVTLLVGLLYLCFVRMMCEFYLAITRMSEDINRRLPRA